MPAPLCTLFGVRKRYLLPWQSFPTLMLFSHGKVYKYSQARKLENLLAFAKVGNMSSSVFFGRRAHCVGLLTPDVKIG